MMRSLFLAFLLLSTPAYAEEAQLNAVPQVQLHGPKEAKGVVLWSPGSTVWYTQVTDSQKTSIPWSFALFPKAGYDLWRLDRPSLSEEYRQSTAWVVEAVQKLRNMGYRRVILAGQSAGAWVSIIAASKVPVDGVIALAPAYYGVNEPYLRMNGYVLRDYLKDVPASTPVLVAFFNGDQFDPGGRGEMANVVLASHRHVVIDHPEGITGHSGAWQEQFTKTYGPCLVSFVETGTCP